jgi:hypothetical protein
MKNFTEKIYQSMEEELDLFTDLGTLPVRRLSGALNVISKALNQLKVHLQAHPFKTNTEEIAFFKYEKPRFFCEQIYVLELYTIETTRPLADKVLLKEFYEQELRFTKRFFTQYQFLYQYYQLDASELDHLFFVRNNKPTDIFLPEMPGLDPEFSASCDYLFGKFMAYERLQEYLIGEIKAIDGPGAGNHQSNDHENSKDLNWTGDAINLVELAYGIWLTGQINHGNATVTEIIQFLEEKLHVKIGRPYRRWQSISKRKRVEPTKYIDELRQAILKRLDDENGLK